MGISPLHASDAPGALASLASAAGLSIRAAPQASFQGQLETSWERLRAIAFETAAQLPLLLVALLILVLAGAAAHFLSRWGGPRFLQARNPFLQALTRRFLRLAIWIGGVVLALDILGWTRVVGAVLGAAGLAGLAVGFAFKDIVENYLAGVILAVRQPFAKNDHLKIEGFEGKVVRLTPRETILMTPDGNHVRLPNALVFRSPSINYTTNPLRQFQFEAGLSPADDLAGARKVALSALGEMDGVLDDPEPQVLITEIGDSTITLRFAGWVDQRASGFFRVRSEAIRHVKGRLEEAGYSLPSPEFLIRMQGDAEPPASAAGRAAEPSPEPDISVDTTVDEQIEADRQTSEEGDLLADGSAAPRGS